MGDQSYTDPLEEKTCPQCGRPNLIEAVKCWFCQAVFESENDQNEPIDKQGEIAQNEKEHFQDQEAQSGENIPEWLKKVRALKAADQPKEEEKPDWSSTTFSPRRMNQKKAA